MSHQETDKVGIVESVESKKLSQVDGANLCNKNRTTRCLNHKFNHNTLWFHLLNEPLE
jgi:hypothetical protein